MHYKHNYMIEVEEKIKQQKTEQLNPKPTEPVLNYKQQ